MLIYNLACNVIMTTFDVRKKSQFVKNAFFNYLDQKSQEAMLKISMEMQKSLFFI